MLIEWFDKRFSLVFLSFFCSRLHSVCLNRWLSTKSFEIIWSTNENGACQSKFITAKLWQKKNIFLLSLNALWFFCWKNLLFIVLTPNKNYWTICGHHLKTSIYFSNLSFSRDHLIGQLLLLFQKQYSLTF